MESVPVQLDNLSCTVHNSIFEPAQYDTRACTTTQFTRGWMSLYRLELVQLDPDSVHYNPWAYALLTWACWHKANSFPPRPSCLHNRQRCRSTWPIILPWRYWRVSGGGEGKSGRGLIREGRAREAKAIKNQCRMMWLSERVSCKCESVS